MIILIKEALLCNTMDGIVACTMQWRVGAVERGAWSVERWSGGAVERGGI